MKTITSILIIIFACNLQAKEIYATFTVYAEQKADLAFNYSGTINTINVDIMSRVKKGDVLATLNSDDLIATLNISKVTLKYAELAYHRHQKIFSKKLTDQTQLEKYESAYETIKAKIELEKTILAKTILRAPFDGVITQRMIELGDVVSGQLLKTAFNIQSEHRRKLIVEFDQKYSNKINIGDDFIYKVDGDNREHKGTIFRIYPAANTNNRKVAVQVAAIDLKVGLFGDGKIIIADKALPSGTSNTTTPR